MLGEPIGRLPEEPFPNARVLDDAFDMSSGGMGVHSYAVNALASGNMEEELVVDSVTRSGSNYLGNPYVLGWYKISYLEAFGPKVLSPRNDLHIQLGKNVNSLYDLLEHRFMRAALGEGTEEDLRHEGEITLTEWQSLLTFAEKSGLVTLGKATVYDIPITVDAFEFGGGMGQTADVGSRVSDSFIDKYNGVLRHEVFRPAILQAAVYKLGFMLAVTDQVTYEAAALGKPVRFEQGPTENSERIGVYWQELLGEEMPGIGALYEQAHGVLTQVAQPDDSYLAHIIAMPTLPQLIRE